MKLLGLSLLLLVCLGGDPDYEPSSSYVVYHMEGWQVHVNRVLLRTQAEPGADALKLLGVKLYDIKRTLPGPAVEKLQTVPIWLEYTSPKCVCACYHPSREWLQENGYNPEKAKSVEIGNVANFLEWTKHQPSMVLHELAHAYHHRVLGYDNPDIKQAFEAAKESGKYESVLKYHGKEERAYALNNDQEYFAELTEAFFGSNDFYPFVKAEVQVFDPVMFAVLKKVWGVKG